MNELLPDDGQTNNGMARGDIDTSCYVYVRTRTREVAYFHSRPS